MLRAAMCRAGSKCTSVWAKAQAGGIVFSYEQRKKYPPGFEEKPKIKPAETSGLSSKTYSHEKAIFELPSG
jgi:hypothetical protein